LEFNWAKADVPGTISSAIAASITQYLVFILVLSSNPNWGSTGSPTSVMARRLPNRLRYKALD
jgi:hypothetical protein